MADMAIAIDNDDIEGIGKAYDDLSAALAEVRECDKAHSVGT
jgi:hypothetical protein